MTSLLTIGAASAAIYGISKGVQNGTFQKLPQNVSNLMNNQTVQQFTKPLQEMFMGQDQSNTITQGMTPNDTPSQINHW